MQIPSSVPQLSPPAPSPHLSVSQSECEGRWGCTDPSYRPTTHDTRRNHAAGNLQCTPGPALINVHEDVPACQPASPPACQSLRDPVDPTERRGEGGGREGGERAGGEEGESGERERQTRLILTLRREITTLQWNVPDPNSIAAA